MNLYTWAKQWGVPLEAIADLQDKLGTGKNALTGEPVSETDVSRVVRMEASKKDVLLMRNNVGALYDQDGRFIRFGLANESKAMNQRLKSSDYIGIRKVQIKQHHVGGILGQFVARETKKSTWSYSGSGREVAQLNFLQLVLAHGGDAAFTNGEGSI